MIWYLPKLIEVDIQKLISAISIKASSEEPDCLGGNVLKGDLGGGGETGVGGTDWLYCIEVGPLGGCDNWAACSENGIAVLSNRNPIA